MTVRRAAALLLAAALAACGSDPPSGTPSGPSPGPGAPPVARPRLLAVTHTAAFRHDSIPVAEAALLEMASASAAFDVEFCRTRDDVLRMLTPAGLAPFAAVAFVNTTGNLGIPDIQAFLDWVAAGHGFVGVHSASDTYHDEPRYLAMLGGEFLTHGAIVPAELRVVSAHPAVAHLPSRFELEDEFYRFTRFDRSGVTVVLAMERTPPDGVGDAGTPAELPLAWHRTIGTGRVFYTAPGHRADLWRDSRFTQHILGAVRWAMAQ